MSRAAPRGAAAALCSALLACLAAAGSAAAAPAPPVTAAPPLRIGIIGAGHIGGTLARLWVAAGHEVLVSSRHPDELKGLAAALGPRAHVGTPRDAALFGEVVVVSVPYGALPQVGRDLKVELAGKIVLDTCNPYPSRDGDMAVEARRLSTGVADPQFLPGTRLVRAFNAINSGTSRVKRIARASPWRFHSPATTRRRSRWRSAWCAMRASSRWWSARSHARASSTSAPPSTRASLRHRSCARRLV